MNLNLQFLNCFFAEIYILKRCRTLCPLFICPLFIWYEITIWHMKHIYRMVISDYTLFIQGHISTVSMNIACIKNIIFLKLFRFDNTSLSVSEFFKNWKKVMFYSYNCVGPNLPLLVCRHQFVRWKQFTCTRIQDYCRNPWKKKQAD